MALWTELYPNPHAPGCFWHDITVKTGAPNIKWCEETLCAVISEPANTWSNLLYILIPLIIWQFYKKQLQGGLRSYPVVIFIMGAGSLIYHASNFYPTQILDFFGMFLFTGWCIGMNLIRLKKLQESKLSLFFLSYSLILTLLLHLMYISKIKFQMIILIAGLVIIATELMAHAQTRKWLFASLGLLIVAFGFSISDGSRLWCSPTNHMIQGHAIWHLVAGVAMFTIWLHYVELTKNKSPDLKVLH
ncbi:MAG: ceramidase [Bacteriovoracaceae bacterium]|nr:ceramidase [Bacteriovoracaceae bacterium]